METKKRMKKKKNKQNPQRKHGKEKQMNSRAFLNKFNIFLLILYEIY